MGPGGAAARAGVPEGSLLLCINDTVVAGQPHDVLVAALRANAATLTLAVTMHPLLAVRSVGARRSQHDADIQHCLSPSHSMHASYSQRSPQVPLTPDQASALKIVARTARGFPIVAAGRGPLPYMLQEGDEIVLVCPLPHKDSLSMP